MLDAVLFLVFMVGLAALALRPATARLRPFSADTKLYSGANEAVLKQKPSIDVPIIKGTSMIEACTAILGLFSAVVFAAHAIDAYRAN